MSAMGAIGGPHLSEPIYFVLEGHDRVLRPAAFTSALRAFSRLLRELDASVSRDPNGSVTWEISSLQKTSPAVIGFRPIPRRQRVSAKTPPKPDYSDEIKHTCVNGLDVLSRRPERLGVYSDRALDNTEYLAKLRTSDRFDDMRVIVASQEATVDVQTLANIQTIKGPTFESLGSVIGMLEAISVHHAFEFRVWSETTGKPVTCRFSEDMLDKVKERLRDKVIVRGAVRWNTLGHPISITVEQIEPAAPTREPTIEEMSGLIEDFTEGVPLKDWLEELRNG